MHRFTLFSLRAVALLILALLIGLDALVLVSLLRGDSASALAIFSVFGVALQALAAAVAVALLGLACLVDRARAQAEEHLELLHHLSALSGSSHAPQRPSSKRTNPCPSCHGILDASALRCHYCGITLPSVK